MQKLLAICCLFSGCSAAWAATPPAVTKAYADDKGRVHIITADGRQQILAPQKWQAGGVFEDVDVASDGKTVGWLASQMLAPFEGGTNYAYTVDLELDIWRDGRVIRRFSPPAYSIQQWVFLKNGNQVAIHEAPSHGQDLFACTLFDVNTGKELGNWVIDRKDYVVPVWAKQLLQYETLPNPADLIDTFPGNPAKTPSLPHK